jgi:hypothetical protein
VIWQSLVAKQNVFFFGIIQRIYKIFAKSTKRWHILKVNISGLTLKPLSSTRWGSHVDSVKAIQFQMDDIREALLQVSKTDKDDTISSEAHSLATNELDDFEFLVGIVIWFEILYAINLVGKQFQEKDMLIDIAIEKVKGLLPFSVSIENLVLQMHLNLQKKLHQKWVSSRHFLPCVISKGKCIFDEIPEDASIAAQSVEESIRINYFLSIVDQVMASLTRRFEQYKGYENIFRFLFTLNKLRSLDDERLMSCCTHLKAALKSGKFFLLMAMTYIWSYSSFKISSLQKRWVLLLF